MVAAVGTHQFFPGRNAWFPPQHRSSGRVKVIHGANDDVFEVVGVSVASVQASLVDAFNIPDDAVSFVDGEEVGRDHRLQDDDTLEFRVCWGRKGALEPDELARLERIEETLNRIEASFVALVQQCTIKAWYTPKEVADVLGKKLYTVQEWCRLMRVNAKKGAVGRGGEREWWISHEELLRIQNEGLLPIRTKY